MSPQERTRSGWVAILAAAIILAVAGSPPARAGSFVVPLDPGRSRINVELCVVDRCDEDGSPVEGYVEIELDRVSAPQFIGMYDFQMELTEEIDLRLSWGFLGTLTATATDVTMMYAQPGERLGPEPIEGGNFTFLDVPTDATGRINYLATGLPCVALQQAELPCEGDLNLEDQGTQTAEQFGGQISVAGRRVTLTSDLDVTVPLDAENPDLGYLRIFGSAEGSVDLPVLLGDVDDDFDVDLADYLLLWGCLGGPGVTTPPEGCAPEVFAASDLDDDADVDVADYITFQVMYPSL